MGPVHFKIETKFNVGDMNILYNGRQQSPRLLIIQCDALMERSPGVWGAGCKNSSISRQRGSEPDKLQ